MIESLNSPSFSRRDPYGRRGKSHALAWRGGWSSERCFVQIFSIRLKITTFY